MGSTRHADDVALLESLREEVRRLQLQDHVRFVANARYSELQAYMRRALVGLHTMWNEHFGISVVEMMAAGLIVVAHNSGGPKMDIVPHPGGNAALASGENYMLYLGSGSYCGGNAACQVYQLSIVCGA